MTIVQTSSMDSFSRLPTLVLTSILGQIQSDRDLFNLTRASPQSLAVYTRYRCTVTRQRLARFLDLDTDGTMLQDALAIINFPRNDESRTISLPVMSDWFHTLTSGSFDHRHSIDSLYRFFTRLVVFIEDYLAKSLDPFPARACMTLPTIGRLVPSMQFKGKETDIKPVSFGTFPAHIQRRLLQAFIRYELRCKIYDPRICFALEGTSYESMADRLNDRFTLNDCEELHCVFEYVRGMYGAVLAQCDYDTWFPDRPVSGITPTKRRRNGEYLDLPSARELGLLFPDDLYFDGAAFSKVRKFDVFPCLGLDLLSSIIKNLPFNGGTPMNISTGFEYLTWHLDGKRWIMRDCFTYNHRLYTRRSRFRSWRWDMPTTGPRWQTSHQMDIERRVRDLMLQILQSRIYRQRGWIFFRDSPGPQPTLPAMEYIAEGHDDVSDWVCLEQEKTRRRSQKWQDYWAARTLEYPLDTDSSANLSRPIRRWLNPKLSTLSIVPRFFSGRTAW